MSKNAEERLATIEAIVPRIEESINNLAAEVRKLVTELKKERRLDVERIEARIDKFEARVAEHIESDREKLGLAYTVSENPAIAILVLFGFTFLTAFFGRGAWDFFHNFI